MNDPVRAVMGRIEESTRIIGEIIMEVSRDVFVADAAGELSGAPPLPVTHRAAITSSVPFHLVAGPVHRPDGARLASALHYSGGGGLRSRILPMLPHEAHELCNPGLTGAPACAERAL